MANVNWVILCAEVRTLVENALAALLDMCNFQATAFLLANLQTYISTMPSVAPKSLLNSKAEPQKVGDNLSRDCILNQFINNHIFRFRRPWGTLFLLIQPNLVFFIRERVETIK